MFKNSIFLKIVVVILSFLSIIFGIALVSLYRTVNQLNMTEETSLLNSQNVSNDVTNVDIDETIDDINNKIGDLNSKLNEYKNSSDNGDNSIKKELRNLKTSNTTTVLPNNNDIHKSNSESSNSEIEKLKNKISSLQEKINTQENDINELKTANSNQVIGAIVAYAGATLPDNYLECNGQEISRSDYADLFSIIGTTYGEGDGDTTFNLPNLQDKFPMASSTKTIGSFVSPGLPNITGSITEAPYPVNPSPAPTISGAFKNSVIGSSNGWTDGGSGRKPVTTKNFSAADGEVHNEGGADVYRNDIYGKSETVQPPALVIKYIIKYKN